MSSIWNLWHGCRKLSPGCANCYVYRGDAKRGIDSSKIFKTKAFDLPVRKNRKGDYKIPSGETVYTCFTSDFFLEDADPWRPRAWEIIKERHDLHFFMITKHIGRLAQCMPEDWGDGYDNVTVCCTVENQRMADQRLPVYLSAPLRHRIIICEPLLTAIDLTHYLDGNICGVIAGGEFGPGSRLCDFNWILDIRTQCVNRNIPFTFRQTGAKLLKDGILFHIPRKRQLSQARKAGLNT